MASSSLRPQIVQVLAAHRERPLTTEEIYEYVAFGMPDFNPTAKRDRNLVNRELSDLAGCSTGSHSKPSPQLLTRLSRGRYIFNELLRPMDLALVQEYLEPQEVYEKRPPRRRGSGGYRRDHVSDTVRIALYAVQRGICPGCGFHQPHYLRFEADHIIALADDGRTEVRNLQLLCPYCNLMKGNGDGHGYRLKMTELCAHNARTGVMVDEKMAVLTGKRLAQYHRQN